MTSRATTQRPLDLTLRQVEYVVAVADHGSFVRAAAACGVSQPSLSAQVARVEDALGAPLFERARPLRLTPAGERVLPHARRVLAEARALEALRTEVAEPLAGRLRFGIIPTFAPYVLPGLHPRLKASLPRLEVAWAEAKTEDLLRGLRTGELDLAWIAEVVPDPALDARVVGHEAFLAVLPAGAPAAARLSDLGPRPLLLLDDGHCLRDQTAALCARHALTPSPFFATSLTTLVQMVAAGLGSTLLPACAVPIEASRAAVGVWPLTDGGGRDAVLVNRASDPRAVLFARVAGEVRALFAAEPGPPPAAVADGRPEL